MYKCKVCGNTRLFEEYSLVKRTLLYTDTGQLVYEETEDIRVEEVECGLCGATSFDHEIEQVSYKKGERE